MVANAQHAVLVPLEEFVQPFDPAAAQSCQHGWWRHAGRSCSVDPIPLQLFNATSHVGAAKQPVVIRPIGLVTGNRGTTSSAGSHMGQR
jgi:hypothetical protein